ncbi:hypothetical protein [Pseudooctadecabacter sp.]|uniref:hypothetical protein n=1 Tax=Pseudooctadecabacter sp. TaxID=1966338 RepID=UPI0035C7BF38
MRLAFCFATLIASPAFAQCPTGADLANGIVFTTDLGDVETFTQRPNGIVQIDALSSEGAVYRTLLGQGVHVLQLSDLEDGNVLPDSIVSTSYPMAASALPVPQPGDNWTVDTMINAYGDIYPETQTQTWGQQTTYTVGDCTFDAVPAKFRYDSDGFTINEDIIYFPTLGLSLLVGYQDTDIPREVYTYVDVAAAQ